MTFNTQPRKLKNLINGEWKSTDTGDYSENRNPANTEDLICLVPLSSIEEAEQAIRAAHAALVGWKNMSPVKRGQILKKAARLMEERKDEIISVLVREQGKTMSEASGEVLRSSQSLEYFAESARNQTGITYPTENTQIFAMTVNEPIGVVSLITPWNFPIDIPCRKLAPALAFGNTVIIKPAQVTAESTLKLVEVLHDAGIPKGVLNLVMGSGSKLGPVLVQHPFISGISFTGSTEVGLQINQMASFRGIKVQAELGGHNTVIALRDANIAKLVSDLTDGCFGSTGQRCTSTRRLLIVDAIAAEVVDKLKSKMREIVVGFGNNTKTQIGPVVEESQLNEVLAAVQTAVGEGATLVAGGSRLKGQEYDKGYFIAPTLLDHVNQEMQIANTEVFGPVLAVIRVNDLDEALKLSNATHYGLSSSIYTSDIQKMMRFIRDTQTGVVHVNKPTSGGEVHIPFGGAKQSGIGAKEMGAAIEFFTDKKTVYIFHDVEGGQ